MVEGIQVFGGFRITPYLAARVMEAVNEVASRTVVGPDSASTDAAARMAGGLQGEGQNAAGLDRTGHEWTA